MQERFGQERAWYFLLYAEFCKCMLGHLYKHIKEFEEFEIVNNIKVTYNMTCTVIIKISNNTFEYWYQHGTLCVLVLEV